MSYEIAKKVICDFLTIPNNEVLSLKGKWGIGKTYIWQKILEETPKDKFALKYYSYVSLFGISSVKELKLKIAMNTISIKKIDSTEHSFFKIIKNPKKWVHIFDSGKSNIPIIKNIPLTASEVLPYFIKDTIICFDDFERLSNNSIKAEEVLGIISELKETKKCKIILIFNNEKLGDNKEIYEKYREKVIDKELIYDPTSEESSNIAYPKDTPYRESLIEYSSKLQINNIRILKKIYAFSKEIDEYTKYLHPNVMKQAIQTLVLVANCYYNDDDEIPKFEFLRNIKDIYIKTSLGTDHDNNNKAEINKWISYITSYRNNFSFDNLDQSIMTIVEHGYLEGSNFDYYVKELDEHLKIDTNRQFFDELWDLYYNSFNVSLDEFVEKAISSFEKSIETVSVNDLNSLISVLNSLGKEDISNQLLHFYADKKINEKNAKDIMKSLRFNVSSSKEIISFLTNKAREFITPSPLKDIILKIVFSDSWSHEDEIILKNKTEEDYYNLFKSQNIDYLPNVIKTCLTLEATKKSTLLALKRIASEDTFNKYKIETWCGISLDDN